MVNYFDIFKYVPYLPQWLKDQGLLSVKDLSVNIHYPAKAR
jgi:hypothetical protein